MFTMENATTLYVSQTKGEDSANGFSPVIDKNGNGPLKTIECALERIAQFRASGKERPYTVALTEDYFLSRPIEIKDGARKITVESFGGKKRIIGGIKIENWTKGTFNGVSCFAAALPEKEDGSPWEFTDLFANGCRASVTRFPKEGTLRITDAENQIDDPWDLCKAHSKWIVVKPEDLTQVDNVTDATVNYFHYWIDEHSPIESYDPETGMMVMKYHSRMAVNADTIEIMHYYLTNVPNTFSMPGEWYLDRKAGVVYFIPFEGCTLDNIEAFLPVTDKIFYISGEDIRLRNLELTCTRGDYASRSTDGGVAYASDVQSVCSAGGAVTFEACTRGGMFNCTIHGVGIHAIEIGKGSHNVRIEDNRIYDICAGGVRIQGAKYGEENSLATTNCVVRRNHIHACGKRYMAGCGVLLMHASECEISDNEIHDLEYTGISVGWCWGYADSSTFGNRITGNHIYDIGKGNLSDMGGIYLLGKQRGTIVAENRVHGVRCNSYGGYGIYLDEGSSYMTVERNVVFDTNSAPFDLHYGSHNTIRNNIFVSRKSPTARTSRNEEHDQLVLEGNIMVTNGHPIFFNERTRVYRTHRNLYYDRTGGPVIAFREKDGDDREYTVEQWDAQFDYETGNIIADPLFVDPDNGDFTLKENSPAYELGFETIPLRITKG